MLKSDTPARKALALELLSSGATIRQIIRAVAGRRHTIRSWKQADEIFRRRWNLIMTQLGRIPEIEEEGK